MNKIIYCRHFELKFGIRTTFIDFRDLNLVRNSIQTNTRVVWMESVTNPLLRVFDFRKVVEIIHSIRKDILVVVDNSFLTPYFLQPLELGADVVIYSTTKFLNGHCDVIMGSLALNNDLLYKRLKQIRTEIGTLPSPLDCFLVQRSLETLSLRMKTHFKNGIIVARFLQMHPAVGKVYHPGLLTHPDYSIAIKQSSGHSGIISFYIKRCDLEMSIKILSKLKVIKIAASTGDIESTITLPALMFSAQLPLEERQLLGIVDNLFLLSVGLEDIEDIVNDLYQALPRVFQTCHLHSTN